MVNKGASIIVNVMSLIVYYHVQDYFRSFFLLLYWQRTFPVVAVKQRETMCNMIYMSMHTIMSMYTTCAIRAQIPGAQ